LHLHTSPLLYCLHVIISGKLHRFDFLERGIFEIEVRGGNVTNDEGCLEPSFRLGVTVFYQFCDGFGTKIYDRSMLGSDERTNYDTWNQAEYMCAMQTIYVCLRLCLLGNVFVLVRGICRAILVRALCALQRNRYRCGSKAGRLTQAKNERPSHHAVFQTASPAASLYTQSNGGPPARGHKLVEGTNMA
jgi:hypothetical protein